MRYRFLSGTVRKPAMRLLQHTSSGVPRPCAVCSLLPQGLVATLLQPAKRGLPRAVGACSRYAPLPVRAPGAGSDALAGQVRAVLELHPDGTLVSLDGRSAYDTILRASFLTALRDVAPELLPFVRLFYGQPSACCWWDCHGRCREISQGEGCEQGDPLAPALSSLGHGGLQAAASHLQSHERLLAFLGGLYILTHDPERARPARDAVVGAVETHCGIASNEGKTRVFRFAAGGRR